MKGYIRRHYHWVIALTVLVEMFVYAGILNNLNGLYLIPVSESLGITRAQYALAFSARSLAGAISVVVSGPLLRRYGYRKMASVFLTVAAGAFLILSACRNLAMLYLGTVLVGICDGCCLTAGGAFMIGKWFHRFHGTVLGLVTAATGIGGSVVCILLTGIMGTTGWRSSFVVCAVMSAAVAVLTAVFTRENPSQLGLAPFGEGETSAKTAKSKRRDDHWHGFTMAQLVRMPNFYLTALEIFLSCLCLYIGFYVMVPYLLSRGLTDGEAASMQSIMLLSMAGFKLLSGVLSDWVGAKSATGLCLAATTVSYYLLIAADNLPVATVAVLVFALGLPLTTVTIPLFTASLFGYCAHNTSNGIFLAMPAAAGMIASPLTNIVFDKTGTYLPAFYGALFLSAAVFVLHLTVCILAKKDKKRLEQVEFTREDIQ